LDILSFAWGLTTVGDLDMQVMFAQRTDAIQWSAFQDGGPRDV
jgi:hypothetical protein